jgi:phospholipid N-methyltransferase
MRADAALIAIEMNPDFVSYLQGSIADPRLRVVQGSAADVEEILRRAGCGRADYIISGIPFSTIPAAVREAILQKTRDVLEPGGAFLVYQFSTRVLQDLKRIFGYVGRKFEPLNVLPAYLFICQLVAA